MKIDFLEDLIVKNEIKLKEFPTSYDGRLDKKDGEKQLGDEKEKLRKLQEKLYADDSQSLLIILQAMDAAGKDSLIKHVMSGVNPQGCRVTSFKTPSSKDYDHDFLWRHYLELPSKGRIGIFNRSHYESVLVCKVHPEYNLNEKVWKNIKQLDKDFWNNRYESIRNFEKHLSNNGTKVIKFFLHVSPEEQKQRFLNRINEEDKNWKFSSADMKERALWAKYQKAYEDAINATSTDYAPWYILPADKKWFTRLAACKIINHTLASMNLEFPELPKDEVERLAEAKKELKSK